MIYFWAWNKWPSQPDKWEPGNRRGQLVQVLARGKMNSCLVEFLFDGHVAIVSRNGLRKKPIKGAYIYEPE